MVAIIAKQEDFQKYLFLRAIRQAAALARIFGECREGKRPAGGKYPRPLEPKEQARPAPACCGVFALPSFCLLTKNTSNSPPSPYIML